MSVHVTCNYSIWFVIHLLSIQSIESFHLQESMGKSEDNRYYMVRGNWEPLARGFKELTHLNEETPKGLYAFDLRCANREERLP